MPATLGEQQPVSRSVVSGLVRLAVSIFSYPSRPACGRPPQTAARGQQASLRPVRLS
jgi:hypothetical protein